MAFGIADFNISDFIEIPAFIKHLFIFALILIGSISINILGFELKIGEFLFTPISWIISGFSGLLGYPIYITYELFSITMALILLILMINSFQETLG